MGNQDTFYRLLLKCVITGGCFAARGPGMSVVLLLLIDQLQQLSGNFNHLQHQSNDIKDRLRRVQKILNFETMIQEVDEEKVVPEKSWPQKGKVEFNQISLRYRPTTERVLNNITLEIEPGKKIGVVGRTGAGKSTVALTLSRILELETGFINVDGIDISQMKLNNLRSKVTMIPQDAVIFSNTLHFNIDPTGEVPKERV